MILLGFLPAAAVVRAAELLYIYDPGCPYCQTWEKEIGAIYGKTAEGRRAPLKPVDKRNVASISLGLAKSIHYTPTFVLMENGTEIGRIEGYPGEHFFWPLLGSLLQRLPNQGESGQIAKPNT